MSKYDVCDDNSEITDYSKIMVKLGGFSLATLFFCILWKKKSLVLRN